MSLRHPVAVVCHKTTTSTWVQDVFWQNLTKVAFVQDVWQKSDVFYKSSLCQIFTLKQDERSLTDSTECTTSLIPEFHPNHTPNFLGTHSNQTKILKWICTARYREIWVSRFGGFWSCSKFRGNCHEFSAQESKETCFHVCAVRSDEQGSFVEVQGSFVEI